jgi:hypothetical protein
MSDWDSLPYHSGFGAHITSEAIAGAVPPIQNNPQRCAINISFIREKELWVMNGYS